MNLTFVKSDSSDIPRLKRLWLACFDEKQQAVDLFFDRVFADASVYCAKDGYLIVSAVYLLNVSLNGQKAHYLCGASTLPQYRKKGIMTRLIEYALNDARENGSKFSLLFPASKDLYAFYSRLGYKSECYASFTQYLRRELESDKNFRTKEPADYELMQQKAFNNSFVLWNNSFVRFAIDYYKMYDVKIIDSDDCIAFYEENDGCAEVFYAAYSDFSALANNLLAQSDAEKFILTGKANQNSKTEKYGMIKSLDDNCKIPENVFIGITLN